MAVISHSQSGLVILCLLSLSLLIHASEPVLGGSLMCVQCTPADPRCESGNLAPTACSEHHNYCGMYRVFIEERQGVFRGCSSQYLRGCRRRSHTDNRDLHDLISMICYQSCSWDGCNANDNGSQDSNRLL